MPSIAEEIQQQQFESPQQKVFINLMFTSGWTKSLTIACLKPLNLTWQQFNLMRILRGQKGKAVPLKVLADRMLDPQSNASRLVDKLVDKGWINRVVCPNDRRQVRLSISDQGAVILEKASIAVRESHIAVGGDLTTKELNTLSDLMDRFRNPRKQKEL